MREQLKEMELELLQYHKSNATLDLMIGELRLKRDGMATEVASLRAELARRDETLLEAISALHKDVSGHRREIKEREDTMAEKDARVGELKKKNQELEKFKFVLNYKIQ